MKSKTITINNTTLNYKGNAELLRKNNLKNRFAFAGTRKGISKTSIDWINSMVDVLDANKHILVSGLAIGTDTIAHKRALENDIPQIVVLPSGVENIYPYQNKKLARDILKNNGVLISLLDNKANPSRNTFLERNKLIIDLSYLLVVNQFNVPSGTLNTVNHAQKAKKIIVVQNADYTGNKYIINSHKYRTVLK